MAAQKGEDPDGEHSSRLRAFKLVSKIQEHVANETENETEEDQLPGRCADGQKADNPSRTKNAEAIPFKSVAFAILPAYSVRMNQTSASSPAMQISASQNPMIYTSVIKCLRLYTKPMTSEKSILLAIPERFFFAACLFAHY